MMNMAKIVELNLSSRSKIRSSQGRHDICLSLGQASMKFKSMFAWRLTHNSKGIKGVNVPRVEKGGSG